MLLNKFWFKFITTAIIHFELSLDLLLLNRKIILHITSDFKFTTIVIIHFELSLDLLLLTRK